MSKVLVIDERKKISDEIKSKIDSYGYSIIHEEISNIDVDKILSMCNEIDVIILDFQKYGDSLFSFIKNINSKIPTLSIIILINSDDIKTASLAIKNGAYFSLERPIDEGVFKTVIENAIIRKQANIKLNQTYINIKEQNIYLNHLIESAQKILLNMLPKSFPNVSDFKFSAVYRSSDEVGGDVYDVRDIGDYICLYVSDVSSHGILASVISVIVKSFIQNIEYNYIQGINTRRFPEIVYDLNEALRVNTASNVFATLFLAFIDKKSKVLYFVSAGHIDQYIVRNNEIISLASTGTILGVFDDIVYKCTVVPLEPKDKIILFTDGITEATRDDAFFGVPKLKELILANKESTIDDLLKVISQEVFEYSKNDVQDDITLLGVELTE